MFTFLFPAYRHLKPIPFKFNREQTHIFAIRDKFGLKALVILPYKFTKEGATS